MTWTGQTFTAGQILTASQMNNLQADITAQANGDSGAPKNKLASMDTDSVDTAQIVASAVTQAKLSTTQSEISVAGSSLLTLPGGEYGFYPQTKVSSGVGAADIAESMSGTSYVTNVYLERLSGSGTIYAQQRYIQASPPYDMGDGVVPLFIFLLINKSTNDIVASYIAPEAPWHYNGPTITKADVYQDGKGYRNVRQMSANALDIFDAVKVVRQKLREGEAVVDSERMLMRDFYLAMKDQPMELQEITQEIKQADMSLVPHPFPNADLTNEAIVLVDPLSNITASLVGFIADEGSAFETTELFRNRFIQIGSTPLTRSGPPGVIQVPLNWRNT